MIRDIRMRAELEEVIRAGVGFVYNDFGGGNPRGCPIHSATCRWLPTMLNVADGWLEVPKIWSDSLPELIAEVEARGKVYALCGGEPGLARIAAGSAVPAGSAVTAPARTFRPAARSVPANDMTLASGNFVHKSSLERVEVWSSVRLPFEPKGWLIDLRACTARLASGLEAGSDQVLHAVYHSNVTDTVDVENVLLYNVGLASFRKGTGRGLRFERAFAACPPAEDGGAYDHYCDYAIAPAEGSFAHWRPVATIARWEGVRTLPLHEMAPCAAIWLEMRRSFTSAEETLSAGQPFGLRIVVQPGRGGVACAAEFVKPLLDGVVAALHRHDGRDLAVLAERLASQLSAPAAEIAELLMRQEGSPLGLRRLLWPRDKGVQWNPGDDQCVAAEIVIAEPSATGAWMHSGELFRVAPSNA